MYILDTDYVSLLENGHLKSLERPIYPNLGEYAENFRLIIVIPSVFENSRNKNMLRSLIALCLACLLVGCDTTSPSGKIQSTAMPSPANLSTTASDSPAPQIVKDGSFDDSLPATSAPVLPSLVTSEEIAMRKEQLELAKNFERVTKLRYQSGVASINEIGRATYFRLTNEIQLLQAQQLLQQKQQADNSKAK